jgi:peptide/nickel transport system substrate-binding protein
MTPMCTAGPETRSTAAALRARALTLLVGVAALVGCGSDEGDAPASRGDGPGAAGGTAVVCLGTRPESLNPFTSPDQLALDLVPVLYSSLVRYGDEGTFRPGLAREWAWSDDMRRLTLRLRDDLAWHDGQPVTPEDVAWTLRTAADPDFAYWQGEDLAEVDSVFVDGQGAVVLTLDRPDASLIESLVALPVLPRHLLQDRSPETFGQASYHREPVGSGPYRFGARAADGSVTLVRSEDYPADLGRGNLDRIVIRPVPDVTSQLIELRTGNVDACVTGARLAEQIADAATLRGLLTGPIGVQVLPLRVDRPPFDDARVRRAISAALDRTEIARLISPLAEPAGTFLPRSNPFRSADLLQPDDDPERAAALLDSAGWQLRGQDDIRTNAAGERLSFTFTGPQAYRELLTLIQEQLRRAGIDSRLRLLETATYFGMLDDPEQRPEAMALTFSPTKVYAYDPFSELHSDGFSNLAGYSDPRIDSLVEALSATADPDTQRGLYQALQREVAEDVPMIYTIYLPRLMIVGDRLQGVEVTPAGPFATVTEWWVAD